MTSVSNSNMLNSNRSDIVSIDKQFWDYFESGSLYNASLSVEPDGGYIVGVYAVLLVAGAAGNVAVLAALARSRRRSRVGLLMTHLAVADVCVTCGVIPLEIGWKYTNAWLAGNFCCKLFLVLRAFGLYLSSNVLVCISVDRFFAVLYPLRLPAARRRSKQMLYCAWAMALACSLPQSIVFSVKQHPVVPGFSQCVSFEAFSSPRQEVAYNVFCLCAMYFLPLAVITACYVRIFAEIHRNSKEIEAPRQEVTYNVFCLCAMYFLPLAVITACYVRIFAEIHRNSKEIEAPHQEVAYNVFCLCAMYFLPLAVITACYVRIFAEIHRNSKEIEAPRQEVAYNVFCLCAMYFLPLAVITACYVRIFAEIHRNSKEIEGSRRAGGPVRLRRSDRGVLRRARRRTLRMTVTIVCVFALCWLPYATMCMWYMVDRDSARRVSSHVQSLLFAMAVSNSCMNPLVYGSYCLNIPGMCRRFCKQVCCVAASASDTIGNSGASSSMKRNINMDAPLVIKNGRVRPRLGVRFAETTLSAGAGVGGGGGVGVTAPAPPPRAPA